MKLIIKITMLCFLAGISACKKDEKPPEPDPVVTTNPATMSSLILEFEDDVNSVPLEFGKNYVNPRGDTFQVSKFSYYISNIVLTAADDSKYTETDSYHLLRHVDGTTNPVTLNKVPTGSYKSVSFMLGVDSARNVSGVQSGDLDPAKATDMFWGWNTGYIFFKFEGSSPRSGALQKGLTYHIGGYGGPYKGQRMFNINFTGVTANVTATVKPLVHLSVNVNELFKTPALIDVSTSYNHMSPGTPENKIFADNYADMISFEHVHNQ